MMLHRKYFAWYLELLVAFFSVDEAETYLNKHSIHDGRMTG